MTLSCPCDPQKNYLECCGLYIEHGHFPPTPEALMRSRYSAYTNANITYIKATMRGKPLLNFNEVEATNWARQVKWIKLQVIHTSCENDKGFVEFIATYKENNQTKTLHECSEFLYQHPQWFYVEGHQPRVKNPIKSHTPRNASCPCGSNKKYKNCHGQSR